MREALAAALLTYFGDREARCLVLTGTDNAFCAGGDLKLFENRLSYDEALERMHVTHAWLRPLLTGDKPVIAAVNGPAVGSGFGLAMLADIVICSDDAYFQPGFSAVGLTPDFGLGATLTQAIGSKRASDILLDNRRLSALEAVNLGLAVAAHPLPDLLSVALDRARHLAAGPPLALQLTKGLVRRAFSSVEDYLALEAASQAQAFASSDHAEGVAALREKRSAKFQGG
jgi:2-(1,2-epoxy-1,2-dihydrophenyl)acetyl-CoA isomerase